MAADKPKRNNANLGVFLRSHREGLTPTFSQSSLGSRRRTPGLRREEVAQLCGVSTTWYTWLEQGRQVSPSAGALSRISRALQLTPAERAYLFEIAELLDVENDGRVQAEIPQGLVTLIRSLSVPAYLLDRQWNAVGWNRAAEKLLRPWFVESPHRNMLFFVFLSPGAKDLLVDWKVRTRRLVAEFRAESGRHLDDPPTRRLIEFLQENSKLFARLWREQGVTVREGGLRQFRIGTGAIVSYEQVSLIPRARPDLRLTTLVPHELNQTT